MGGAAAAARAASAARMAAASRAARALGLALLVAALPRILMAQEGPPLRAEFWMDLFPVPQAGEPEPLPGDLVARRLVEEAAWIFSGMVEGFSFEWTPSDIARAVAERFVLSPFGAIPFGDPRLRPGPSRRESGRLLAWIEFAPDAADRAALAAHGADPWKPAQGRGGAGLERGYPGRRAAYEDAVREAIRGLLRSLEPNKPKIVRGRAVFQAAPLLAIVEGRYQASVRMRIEVTEILEYVNY